MDTPNATGRRNLEELRAQIAATLEHLDHVLPGQAPILNFVHHNTLHGYQHLSFEQALAEAEQLTGIRGYLPEEEFRRFYRQGRIDADDLDAALMRAPYLTPDKVAVQLPEREITRGELYRIALLYETDGLTAGELAWRSEERGALRSIQDDVPPTVRAQLLGGRDEAQTVGALWQSCLTLLDLQQPALHPESMLDLSAKQAETLLAYYRAQTGEQAGIHERMRETARAELQQLCAGIGENITLRGFLLALTGTDILDTVRPQLIRLCASVLDEGLAAWQLPERAELGFYAAWREICRYDLQAMLYELPEGRRVLDELPDTALDAIIWQLTQLGIAPEKWDGYLQRLALEMPGWSGMFNWRQRHPDYRPYRDAKPQLADYLAIRLTLDRLWLKQLCRETWRIDADLNSLQRYWQSNLSEFMVRRQLYLGVLPEYLTHAAETLTLRSVSERRNPKHWRRLADLVWTWRFSPATRNHSPHTAHRNGWRLFRLAQHLGLNAEALQQAKRSDAEQLLAVVDAFSADKRAQIWLYAYERHYREAFFNALRANQAQAHRPTRVATPEAQAVFCMDEREESIRRHLEELDAGIETFGAAGFFGIAMNWRGLDDSHVTPLCPVVVTPVHEVREIPRPAYKPLKTLRAQRQALKHRLSRLLTHDLRHNAFAGYLLINFLSPILLLALWGKIFSPKSTYAAISTLLSPFAPQFPTHVTATAPPNESMRHPPLQPRIGFTDTEQAERLGNFLRTIGLTKKFAPIVAIIGHGSTSQNNPHEAAHDCGACGGRQGGPNARVFACMANRREVRALLAEQGIVIPEGTWFVGAQHDTCSDKTVWYDVEDIPQASLPAFTRFERLMKQARSASAHERCRRFASAVDAATLERARMHVEERSVDLSQARPEFGHASNAAAIVGRRSLSQGIFFDRRVFLISYDPTQDPQGKIVENILLTAGPVGAGINLEYYFSTVNNERYGCGTKTPHNITGGFAVMEGTASDLRTGLPKQMVEIHEAMRLQLLVEAKTAVLEEIYARQAALRELIANGWLYLSAKDPDSGAISVFERGVGFVLWGGASLPLPVHVNSPACYRGETEPVPPALIRPDQTQRNCADE